MPKTKTKSKTLRDWISEVGTQDIAAHKLGVTFVTLNRWLNGHSKPSPLAWKELHHYGVTKI